MRVAFVLEDLLMGGAQRHSLDLAARLERRGLDVALSVLGAEVDPGLAREAGPRLRVLAQAGLRRPSEWLRLGRALRGADAQATVAVGPVAGCVAAAAGAPGLVCVQHMSQVASAAGWLRTAPFILAARRARAVVFVSHRQAAHWRARGLGGRRARVIRNGVDLARHRPATPAERAAARARLGLGPATLALGSVAMFRPEKGHLAMVEALRALRAAGCDAELLLVGDGPTRPAVEAAAARLGVADKVRVCGQQAEVRPWAAAMDAGVFASTRVETLPLAGIELMAMGAPLVAPRLGGLEELVADGEDGLLFPPGDGRALLAALGRMADPALRARLAGRAVAKAQGFCAEAMADGYERVLAEAAGA